MDGVLLAVDLRQLDGRFAIEFKLSRWPADFFQRTQLIFQRLGRRASQNLQYLGVGEAVAILIHIVEFHVIIPAKLIPLLYDVEHSQPLLFIEG